MTGAYTSVSVLPSADTPMTAWVADRAEPFVSIVIGEGGHGVTLIASDEETLNALAIAIGQARAKLVGAITRAKRPDAKHGELSAAS